ncbi:nucleotide disphospho-sugar-binding domain-containing protein [Deinococcus sp. 6GRE01]|uniref:nucleotide disphospho-sugar-binding domain-containing protein n=1 Tax=Deinococcus sp. 6GRE01 TaxID=2745873 RepID=UPI00351D01BE
MHHGGAGTTAAGLAAGVPNVIVPFFGDQPFWGDRVQRLGVGPAPVPRRALNEQTLAEALTRAVTDAGMHDRAAALGARIRAEGGAVPGAVGDLDVGPDAGRLGVEVHAGAGRDVQSVAVHQDLRHADVVAGGPGDPHGVPAALEPRDPDDRTHRVHADRQDQLALVPGGVTGRDGVPAGGRVQQRLELEARQLVTAGLGGDGFAVHGDLGDAGIVQDVALDQEALLAAGAALAGDADVRRERVVGAGAAAQRHRQDSGGQGTVGRAARHGPSIGQVSGRGRLRRRATVSRADGARGPCV